MTWTHLGSPPGGATALVPDPVTPLVLFAANSIGIFKSADGGQTWQLAYAGNVSAPVIDPGNHLRIAAVASGSVIRSLDGRSTWTVAAPTLCGGLGCGQLLADPTGSGTLLAVTAGIISRDWGLTFQRFGPTGGVGSPISAAFDPSHAGWIYVDKAAGVMGSLFLTTDCGATWTQKASPPSTFSNLFGLAVDPGSYTGYLAKLSSNATLSYATYYARLTLSRARFWWTQPKPSRWRVRERRRDCLLHQVVCAVRRHDRRSLTSALPRCP